MSNLDKVKNNDLRTLSKAGASLVGIKSKDTPNYQYENCKKTLFIALQQLNYYSLPPKLTRILNDTKPTKYELLRPTDVLTQLRLNGRR